MEPILILIFSLCVCLTILLVSLSKQIFNIHYMLVLASQDRYSELKEFSEKLSSKNIFKKEK